MLGGANRASNEIEITVDISGPSVYRNAVCRTVSLGSQLELEERKIEPNRTKGHRNVYAPSGCQAQG